MDEDLWDPDDFIVDNDSEDEEDVEDVRNNPLSLTQIAGEEVRRLWSSDHYSPPDDKIFTVKALVRSGVLQNEIREIQQRWRLPISLNPTLPQIARSALLAHHGLLGSVRDIHLPNIDLTPVPPEHLTSLASCATEDIRINNVRGCGLVSFLDGLKCENLIISDQSLGMAETRALIQATESRVKNVDLKKGVTLECLKSLPEIAWSANLAHQGLLGSVGEIHLRGDIDLSSVPADHLASLASCVAGDTHILRGPSYVAEDGVEYRSSLAGFLDSLKCQNLIVHQRSLGMDEFNALTQATEPRVVNVNLLCELHYVQDISFSAVLAHQGRLTSVQSIELNYADMSSNPIRHLMSLVPCVSETFTISAVGGCDIVNIMNSLRCKTLKIASLNLRNEETLSLVQAMETNVEEVVLGGNVWGFGGDVRLDINELTRYSGLGRCRKIIMAQELKNGARRNGRGTSYIEDLKTWARSRNWRNNQQTLDRNICLLQIERNDGMR